MYLDTVFIAMGRGFKGPSAVVQGPEKLVARQVHLPFQNCPHDDQMQTRPRSCVQDSPERQYQLAVEWSHDQQGACVGVPDSALHLQTPQNAG